MVQIIWFGAKPVWAQVKQGQKGRLLQLPQNGQPPESSSFFLRLNSPPWILAISIPSYDSHSSQPCPPNALNRLLHHQLPKKMQTSHYDGGRQRFCENSVPDIDARRKICYKLTIRSWNNKPLGMGFAIPFCGHTESRRCRNAMFLHVRKLPVRCMICVCIVQSTLYKCYT